MTGPLTGIRVVDCSRGTAGTRMTWLMADYGADVIWVEPPGGDPWRDELVVPYSVYNRNKRSVELDLADRAGRETLLSLCDRSDVFVETWRPGVSERLDLGFETIHARAPHLVYCSISGFGHTGPYRERGGFDLVAQAMSGIASFTGEIGSTRPVAAGVPLSDLAAGSFGALGILAALHHQRATGQGQKVEATLLESALGYAIWETGLYLATGEVAKPRGSRHRLAAPYEALKTADGFIAVGVTSQRLWSRFCRALRADDLENDADFATPADRIVHRDALQERLEIQLGTLTTAQWMERLLAEGVPCGPVNTIAEAVNDPQIAARALLVEVEGRRFTRAPVVLSETPVTVKTGAAAVGQHTAAVLDACGYDARDIDDLAARGVIGLGTAA